MNLPYPDCDVFIDKCPRAVTWSVLLGQLPKSTGLLGGFNTMQFSRLVCG